MQRPANIIFYNHENIMEWKTTLESVPIQIQRQQAILSQIQADILFYSTAVNRINLELISVSRQIFNIKIRIQILELLEKKKRQIWQKEDPEEIQQTQERVANLIARIPDFPLNDDLKDLKRELEEVKIRESSLKKEKISSATALSSTKNKQEGIDNKIAQLNEILREHRANQFLMDLYKNEKRLATTLISKIEYVLDRYDDDNPQHQNANIRSCILDIRNTLDFFKRERETKKEEKSAVLYPRYYQIAGLIWSHCEKLPASENDFLQRLTTIFKPESVDIQESILEFKYQNFPLKLFTMDEELVEEEKKVYRKVANDFEISLENNPKLTAKGKELLNLIDAKIRQDKEVDLKFYTYLLTRSRQLIEGDKNEKLYSQYKNFANVVAGRGSKEKQIAGAMLAFLGVILVVVSSVTTVLSGGSMSPLTMAGIFAGGACFMSGARFFNRGRCKGLSRAIQDFEQIQTLRN